MNKHQPLKKYADICSTVVWVKALEKKIERHVLYRRPSLAEMAYLYPSEHELKLLKNSNYASLSGSKINWFRLRNGKMRAVDNPCIRRVDREHPEIKYLRKHPFWFILGHPSAAFEEIKIILDELKPSLNGHLFNIADNALGIAHKKLYGLPENVRLINSLDAFTLMLVMYRLNKLEEVKSHWHNDLKSISFLMLRLISLPPMSYISKRLLRLFLAFISVNEKNLLPEEIDEILATEDIDAIFQQIFCLIHPGSLKRPSETTSLDKYLQSQKTLVLNFWKNCFPDDRNAAPQQQFTMETLFWADYFSQYWLDGKIAKTKLFDPDSHLYEIQREYHFDKSKRQIW